MGDSVRRGRTRWWREGLTAGAAGAVLLAGVLSVPAVGGTVASAVQEGSPPEVVQTQPGSSPQPSPTAAVDPGAAAREVVPPMVPAARRFPAQRPSVRAPLGVQERGHAVLAALDYPWQELGYTIRFLPWTGGPLLGQTTYGNQQITIFVRPEQGEASLRATVGHELGHALDALTGTAAQRSRYLQIRGIQTDRTWFPCEGCEDFGSPAGDWAEVFAVWLFGPGDFRGTLASPPDAAGLRSLAPLFAPPSARQPVPTSSAPSSARPSPEPSPSPDGGLLPWLPH